MTRVHKSLRIDAGDADRVRALMGDGESEAAAYGRVIRAGLDALEASERATGGAQAPDGAAGAQEGAGGDKGPSDALTDALRAHIGALDGEVSTLRAQLDVKDAQIAALTRITEQSQTLHAIAESKGAKAIGTGDARGGRRGFLARLFGREE